MERVSLSSSSGARGWDTDWGLPKVEVGSFLESSPLPALRLELRASNPRELQVDGPPGLAWRLEGGFSLNQLVLGQQAQFKGPVRFLDLTGRDRWQAELPPWMAFSDLYLRVRALSPSRSAPWSNMATWSPR